MESLDHLYVQHLERGLLVLRQAIYDDDSDWAKAEVELLHNIPTLIGEQNHRRHIHFWNGTRTLYLAWVERAGRERAKSRMRTFYAPIWEEMAPLIAELE